MRKLIILSAILLTLTSSVFASSIVFIENNVWGGAGCRSRARIALGDRKVTVSSAGGSYCNNRQIISVYPDKKIIFDLYDYARNSGASPEIDDTCRNQEIVVKENDGVSIYITASPSNDHITSKSRIICSVKR